MNVTVYCASSSKVNEKYYDVAVRTAKNLVENNFGIIYGGGSSGLMGKLADAALDLNGKVIGIIPSFMMDVEWGHTGITELIQVEDMSERKKKLIINTEAVVALPGGTGTLEELTEVITLKRLNLFHKPIIIVNTDGFYDPLKALFDKMIDENFFHAKYSDMWQFVDTPEEIADIVINAEDWNLDLKLAQM